MTTLPTQWVDFHAHTHDSLDSQYNTYRHVRASAHEGASKRVSELTYAGSDEQIKENVSSQRDAIFPVR
jgi:hypothetical protein